MEDFSIRAIVIGVSLFVTMLTLSAILIYFNTARNIADEANKRADIASAYESIMYDKNFSEPVVLTGVQVRSLLTKYISENVGKEKTIDIQLTDSSIIESVEWTDVLNNGWYENTGSLYIVSKQKLDIINPVSNYKFQKVVESEKTIFKIEKI